MTGDEHEFITCDCGHDALIHARCGCMEVIRDGKDWDYCECDLDEAEVLRAAYAKRMDRIAELEAQAERVCKWTFSTDQHTAEFSLYKSQCGNDFDMLPTDYCYMCGGKVEVTK